MLKQQVISKDKKGKKAKKVILKFTIDSTAPVDDGIMDAASFVSYFLLDFFLIFLIYSIGKISS